MTKMGDQHRQSDAARSEKTQQRRRSFYGLLFCQCATSLPNLAAFQPGNVPWGRTRLSEAQQSHSAPGPTFPRFGSAAMPVSSGALGDFEGVRNFELLHKLT